VGDAAPVNRRRAASAVDLALDLVQFDVELRFSQKVRIFRCTGGRGPRL